MKHKLLKKICGILGYKLLDKTLFKNQRSIDESNKFTINIILSNLFHKNQIKELLQIGANDGKSFDELNVFIKKHKPKSVLVEPIKTIFKILQKNYNGFDNVTLENLAVSVNNEISEIYKVDESFTNFYDDHIKAISSFNKAHLINHGVKKKHISTEKVSSSSISNLISKYKLNNLDLLFLDTEGYDGKIVLDLINNTKVRPFIIFEYIHIDNNILNNLINRLNEEKYFLLKVNENIFCFQEEEKFDIDFSLK